MRLRQGYTLMSQVLGTAFCLMAVAIPTASAQEQACGDFTTTLARTDVKTNGATVGYVELLMDGCNQYVGHARVDQAPGGYAGPFVLTLVPWIPAYDQLNLGQATITSTGDVYTKPAALSGHGGILWLNIHLVGTDVNFHTTLAY